MGFWQHRYYQRDRHCVACRFGKTRFKGKSDAKKTRFVLGPCVVSLEESPSSRHSRPAKLCISFVGVSDLLLIAGYVIRCGKDYV